MRRFVFLTAIAVLISAGFGYVLAANQSQTALTGIVRSDAEGNMEGVLVSAKKAGSTIRITVVSDDQGRYAFPTSKLQPGTYEMSIRAVGYKLQDPGSVQVSAKKPAKLDLKLNTVSYEELSNQLTSTEWLESVPGTDKQKGKLYQCVICHDASPIVKSRHDAQEFMQLFPRMRNHMANASLLGSHAAEPDAVKGILPGDDEYAEYLASINLSRSTDGKWSYELKKDARPKGRATKVIMTEYDLPDPLIEPHDALFDKESGMVWFSEFSRNFMGQLDPRTGKVTEWPLPVVKPGAPEGSLKLALDKDGNPWIGMFFQAALGRFNKKTQKFEVFSVPRDELGHNNERTGDLAVSPDGTVWTKTSQNSKMYRLNLETKEWTTLPMPPGMGWYGMEADAQGNIYSCSLAKGAVGEVNVHEGDLKMVVYPTPTPNSGSRRGHMDSLGRLWFGEFNSGGMGMFDPKTKEIKEWAPPSTWAGSYDANIDKNFEGWSAGLSSDYLFRLDPQTGKYTEYLLPTWDENIRRVDIDETTTPVTIWMGEVHRGKIIHVEPLD